MANRKETFQKADIQRNVSVEHISHLATIGDVETLKALGREGIICLGVKNDNGESALFKLAAAGKHEAVNCLLNLGANIDEAVAGFASAGHTQETLEMLRCGGSTAIALYYAILCGDKDKGAELLNKLEPFRDNSEKETIKEELAYAQLADTKVFSELSEKYLVDAFPYKYSPHEINSWFTPLEKEEAKFLRELLNSYAQVGHLQNVVELINRRRKRVVDKLRNLGRDYLRDSPDNPNTLLNQNGMWYCIEHAIKSFTHAGHFAGVDYLLKQYQYESSRAKYYLPYLYIESFKLLNNAGFLQGDERSLRTMVFYPNYKAMWLVVSKTGKELYPLALKALKQQELTVLAQTITDMMEKDGLTYNSARLAATPIFQDWFIKQHKRLENYEMFDEALKGLFEQAVSLPPISPGKTKIAITSAYLPPVALMTKAEKQALYNYAEAACKKGAFKEMGEGKKGLSSSLFEPRVTVPQVNVDSDENDKKRSTGFAPSKNDDL